MPEPRQPILDVGLLAVEASMFAQLAGDSKSGAAGGTEHLVAGDGQARDPAEDGADHAVEAAPGGWRRPLTVP